MITPLLEAVVKFRGRSYRVRELNFIERMAAASLRATDFDRMILEHVALGTIDPKLTVEDAGKLPAELVELLFTRIIRLASEAPARKYRLTEVDTGNA